MGLPFTSVQFSVTLEFFQDLESSLIYVYMPYNGRYHLQAANAQLGFPWIQSGRISYPLDPSVGSIGIAGVLGSSAGGGAQKLDGNIAWFFQIGSETSQEYKCMFDFDVLYFYISVSVCLYIYMIVIHS